MTMQRANMRKTGFEWAPFLLRYGPLALVALLAVAVAAHRWWPISVAGLPAQFDLSCTGTVSSFLNGAPDGGPRSWRPRYHVDLARRRVDNLVNGKSIRIGAVDDKHAAFWVEDDDSRAGRNIVTYFYRENRLAGSLALDTRGYQAAQVKKASCARTGPRTSA